MLGCVAQLVEQRSPKSPVGGSNPSALDWIHGPNEARKKRRNYVSKS